jgi:hypothetical protein
MVKPLPQGIVGARPQRKPRKGKTATKWRGLAGLHLFHLVQDIQEDLWFGGYKDDWGTVSRILADPKQFAATKAHWAEQFDHALKERDCDMDPDTLKARFHEGFVHRGFRKKMVPR